MIKILSSSKIQILFLVLLTFLAYSNIFPNGFILDDKSFIVESGARKELSHLPNLLLGQEGLMEKIIGYRPVRDFVFVMLYKIGGFNTFVYHAYTVLIALLITATSYLIFQRIFKNNLLAFAGGLLFALHPIHTEGLTFITSGVDMTGVFFLLLSFLFFIKSNQFLSIFFALLAYFTYEPAIILPLLLLLYDIYFGHSKLKTHLPFFLGAVAYLLIRSIVLGHSPTEAFYYGNSFYHTQLLMIKVVAKHLYLLVFPLKLSLSHIIPPGIETFAPSINNAIPFSNQSLSDSFTIASILLIVALLAAALLLYKKIKIVSFGLLWIFISLIPFINLFPQPTPLSERYLFLASFGFVLILVWVIENIAGLLYRFPIRSGMTREVFTVILVLMISSFYFIRTFTRNFDWKDPISLWSAVLQVYPNSANANYVLGNNYKEINGQLAAEYYQKSIELNPYLIPAYLNLGNYYYLKNDYEMAEKILIKATQVDFEPFNRNDLSESIGGLSSIYNTLALVYKERGQEDKSYLAFLQALSLDPQNPQAKQNLADLIKKNPKLKSLVVSASQEKWQTFTSQGFTFIYPENWQIKNDGNDGSFIKLNSPDRKNHIEIKVEPISGLSGLDDYLKDNKDNFGQLVKERYTRLPNFDDVYVKLWLGENQMPILEFFAHKQKKVYTFLTYPATPDLKIIFDDMMRSFKIN